MIGQFPLVTIILPCREEQDFIEGCLTSILKNRYPRECLEILVVDGMSRDRTREIVYRIAKLEPCVKLVDNPKGVVPAALNLGIEKARGEVVMRMDAHVEYPPDYVPRLVEWLQRTGADNVGGCCVTRPSGDSAVASAIASALSHPFGVGNSRFRLGTSTVRLVDTVPFGCFPRAVFDRVGLFDEDLTRNQDDEFNHRLNRSGGKVMLVPDVVSYYYARPSLRKLAGMFYQYGYFKPLVNRKVGSILTMRQLVPAAFLSSVVLLGLLSFFIPGPPILLLGILTTYVAVCLGVACWAMAHHGFSVGLAHVLVFPTIHVSYGFGYLRGIARFLVARLPPPRVDLSR